MSVLRTVFVVSLVGLAGCFSPDVPDGYECGAGSRCPPGQTCQSDGICRAPSAADAGLAAHEVTPEESGEAGETEHCADAEETRMEESQR